MQEMSWSMQMANSLGSIERTFILKLYGLGTNQGIGPRGGKTLSPPEGNQMTMMRSHPYP